MGRTDRHCGSETYFFEMLPIQSTFFPPPGGEMSPWRYKKVLSCWAKNISRAKKSCHPRWCTLSSKAEIKKKVLVIPDVPKGIFLFHRDISFLSPQLHQLHFDAFSAASLNGTDPEFNHNLVDMNRYFDIWHCPLIPCVHVSLRLPGDESQATGVSLASTCVFVVVIHLWFS